MQAPAVPSDAPPWLVDFLMTPPWWFIVGLVALAGGCLAVAGWKVAGDDWYISTDEQRQMCLIVGTAEAVALGVMVAMDVLDLSYFPAVGVGLVGGFAVVEVVRRGGPVLDAHTRDETAHIAVAWTIILASALGAPAVVNGGRATTALSIGIGTIATGMLLWGVLQAQGEGKTLGESMRSGNVDD